MLIDIRHSNRTPFDDIYVRDFQDAVELKNHLKSLLDSVEDQENTLVHFNDFVNQGFVDPDLSGLPIKGNIDTILSNITQDAVDFANLDDDDQTHYENARELDILKETVAETVEYMQWHYLGKHDDLKSYVRQHLDEHFDIPSFVMETVDMNQVCSAYESDYDYTFVDGYLYVDLDLE